jgi:hypothetical protein
MNFPGRIGLPALVPVSSSSRLARAIANWNHPKSWLGNPAKPPASVAQFAGGGAITTTGLEMLLDVGVVSTVWDTGLPLAPAGIWAVMRYAVAIDVSFSGLMCLSPEAAALRYHHRTAMSEYLGIAVAMQVVKEIVATSHPGAQARFVDAEFALASGSVYPGFTATTQNSLRPDYFVFVDGGPIYVLECKGSGSTGSRTSSLAKAIRQLRSVQYQGLTPQGFCTHVELTEESFTCVVFDPEGDEEWSTTAARDPDHLGVRTVGSESEDESVVLDVAGLRRELEDISRAALLEWSGAARSADRLIPPRVTASRNRPLREVDAPTTSVVVGGFEFDGVEATYPYDGRSIQVFRGIDANLRESLLEISSSDNPQMRSTEPFDRYTADVRQQIALGDDDQVVAVNGDGAMIRIRIH